jgi:hypothetical protein
VANRIIARFTFPPQKTKVGMNQPFPGPRQS